MEEKVVRVSVCSGEIKDHGVWHKSDVEDFFYVHMAELQKQPSMWGIKDQVHSMILDRMGVSQGDIDGRNNPSRRGKRS